MSKLHWSLDYSYQRTEREFQGEFSRILSKALASSSSIPMLRRRRTATLCCPTSGEALKAKLQMTQVWRLAESASIGSSTIKGCGNTASSM